jgi:hypothetical protein
MPPSWISFRLILFALDVWFLFLNCLLRCQFKKNVPLTSTLPFGVYLCKATEYEGRLKAQGVRDVEKLSLFGEAGDAQKRPATAPPPGRFASPTYKSSFSLS